MDLLGAILGNNARRFKITLKSRIDPVENPNAAIAKVNKAKDKRARRLERNLALVARGGLKSVEE